MDSRPVVLFRPQQVEIVIDGDHRIESGEHEQIAASVIPCRSQ
jgi:hypothetical protein